MVGAAKRTKAEAVLVLGIESSCDETAVALVRNGCEILSSSVSSQVLIHAQFGGVVPEVAAREHLRAINQLLGETLRQAQTKIADIDAIAVTQGPGLIGALLVGIAYAKGLAIGLEKPLIPVDHVHAHVHGALLGLGSDFDLDALWPCLSLVVSGGHTNLYYMTGPTRFNLIASSVDDACGECFDKVAKMLGLPYPGGVHIERLARNGDHRKVLMPKLVERKSQLFFSYSGLKTHLANLIRSFSEAPSAQDLADICASFQEEALRHIVRKLVVARQLFPATKSLLVAGGVAANQRLRDLIREEIDIPAYFPPQSFCADNAAMIASYGYHLWREHGPMNYRQIDWDAYSRYKFEEVEAVNG